MRTTEGVRLRKEGENLVAEIDDEERGRIPLHMLGAVVTFGAISVSPPLIGAMARAGITLVLLDRQGRFEARIEGPVSGNVCYGVRSIGPRKNLTRSYAASSRQRSPISASCSRRLARSWRGNVWATTRNHRGND